MKINLKCETLNLKEKNVKFLIEEELIILKNEIKINFLLIEISSFLDFLFSGKNPLKG